MFSDLLEFISNFHHKKLRKQCIIHEKISCEKIPTGHCELKMSCDHPVT